MTILDTVKARNGIYYSDPLKDREIQSIIDGAKQDLELAGVKTEDLESPLAVEAIILYVKMNLSPEPSAISLHPFYVSYIAKLRASYTT